MLQNDTLLGVSTYSNQNAFQTKEIFENTQEENKIQDKGPLFLLNTHMGLYMFFFLFLYLDVCTYMKGKFDRYTLNS